MTFSVIRQIDVKPMFYTLFEVDYHEPLLNLTDELIKACYSTPIISKLVYSE